jgi:hypothetical protein
LRLPPATPPALLFDLIQLGGWQPIGQAGGEVSLTPRSVARAGGCAHVGIAAVARGARGAFLGWESRQLGRMTNNEAEYHAALPSTNT